MIGALFVATQLWACAATLNADTTTEAARTAEMAELPAAEQALVAPPKDACDICGPAPCCTLLGNPWCGCWFAARDQSRSMEASLQSSMQSSGEY
ncbi:hypothetical protein [Polyangium aurulentum]|uniref:hypothetical protein n=1 Tax=Polyangium aurulentum TaxID=2567896 RepID=UPI00200CDD9E|nr:hypothetical protein [Polyangium aurulentum]UQA60554.1 hypothetical protein E8A73_008810 [Polyangium aurulentum]